MQLHVLTSCTDRKRRQIAPEAQLRGVNVRHLALRAESWLGVLANPRLQGHSVRSLYGGEHWTEFCSLLERARERWDASGWVISAGYGLLPVDGRAVSYSATFSASHQDRVRPEGVAWSHRDWWSALAGHRIPGAAEQRSILDLVRSAPRMQLLCAASYPYLDAVATDLLAAADEKGTPGSILVLGTKVPSSLRDHPYIATPDFNSRLQGHVGGSKIGLNVRVARYVLDGWNGREIGVHGENAIGDLMREAPELVRIDRAPATDEEIQAFIRQSLTNSPSLAASPLLRTWRDAGRACEQGRFRRLYKMVRAGRPA